MTGTAAEGLFENAGLAPRGPVRWGLRVPLDAPGVYVIEAASSLREAPIDLHAVAAWIERVPTLRVDGRSASPEEVTERLASFWIPQERVIYIGRAGSSVAKRMRQFYRTPLGDPRPHAGGHWLKTLRGLDGCLVWWAGASDPTLAEAQLLARFAERHGGGLVLPFANRQAADGQRKLHGITGSTLPANPGLERTTAKRAIRPAEQVATGGLTVGDRLAAINAALQQRACRAPDGVITAVEGAAELDRLGILKDRADRRGLPLRNLLRAGRIEHAYQEGGRFWFIRCAKPG